MLHADVGAAILLTGLDQAQLLRTQCLRQKCLPRLHQQLDEAVQKAVQKLMDDGTYMKILKHWGVESGALDKAEINPTDLN